MERKFSLARFFALALIVVLALFVIGCGGGGTSDHHPKPPVEPPVPSYTAVLKVSLPSGLYERNLDGATIGGNESWKAYVKFSDGVDHAYTGTIEILNPTYYTLDLPANFRFRGDYGVKNYSANVEVREGDKTYTFQFAGSFTVIDKP